jgi:hypothetical protein
LLTLSLLQDSFPSRAPYLLEKVERRPDADALKDFAPARFATLSVFQSCLRQLRYCRANTNISFLVSTRDSYAVEATPIILMCEIR